jgi:hypothetical protein
VRQLSLLVGIATLCVTSTSLVRGGELEIKARVQPPGPYLVGDNLTVQWEITHDASIGVESDLASSVAKALQDAGFEATGAPEPAAVQASTPSGVTTAPLPPAEGGPPVATVHTTKVGTNEVLVVSAPVTTFTTGVHRIAPVTVSYKQGGQAKTASTPEMVVPVQSLLGPKLDIKPIHGPVPYRFQLVVPGWFWAVLAFLAAALMLWFRRRPAGAAIPIPLAPDIEAFRRIDTLLSENLPGGGQVKEFCDRLSDILRQYLGRRYGLSVMGETSGELMTVLREDSRLPDEDMTRLGDFLEQCDLAKFAKHQPTDESLGQLVGSAREIVVHTAPAPQTPAQQATPDTQGRQP